MTTEGLTPFTLNLAAAFPFSAMVAFNPWVFFPPTATLLLDNGMVAPSSWDDCERLAAGREDAQKWLAIFREDVEAAWASLEGRRGAWGPSRER